MSSERQRRERVVAVRRVVGRLFQMTGPAMAKLLIASVVLSIIIITFKQVLGELLNNNTFHDFAGYTGQ